MRLENLIKVNMILFVFFLLINELDLATTFIGINQGLQESSFIFNFNMLLAVVIKLLFILFPLIILLIGDLMNDRLIISVNITFCFLFSLFGLFVVINNFVVIYAYSGSW